MLHRAAGGHGSARLVQFLLEHGANPEVRDGNRHTIPLTWAYRFGRAETVSILMASAPIHAAVNCDGVDRVRALLAQDPSLSNARDIDGRTPLHCLHKGLRHGVELIRLLVASGADVNARDAGGVSVVGHARRCVADDLLDSLRSLGAVATE